MYRGYDGAGVSYTELEVLPDFSGINTLSTGIIGGATRGPLTKTKVTNAKKLRQLYGDPVKGDWGLWAALKVLKNSNLIWYKRVVSANAAYGKGEIAGKLAKWTFRTSEYDEYLNGAKITVSIKPGASHNEIKIGDEILSEIVHGGSTITNTEASVELTKSDAGEVIPVGEGEGLVSVKEIKVGTKVYVEGVDYTVDLTTGAITWVSGGEAPAKETAFTVVYEKAVQAEVLGDALPISANQNVNQIKKVHAKVDGVSYEYTEDVDFSVNKDTGVITWISRPGNPIALPKVGQKYHVLYVLETINTVFEQDRYDINLTKNGNVLEKLTNFVLDPESSDFIVTALGQRSDYLVCEVNPSFDAEAANAYVNEEGEPVLNGVYTIAGGNGGIEGLTDADYIGTKGTDEGMQDFLDAEALDISTFIIPGVYSDSVIFEATQIAEKRGDVIYIAEMPEGLTPQQADKFSRRKGDWTPTLSNKLHLINSKFVAMYYPWILEYVADWGENVYTPPSAWVASQFAYNDTVANTWFAPAGFQSGTQGRGVLTSALGLEHNCTQAERDILYADDNGCVNPIVGFVQKGITLWGNKTTLRTGDWAVADSSWTQLSVRRLCNYCRKVIIKTSMETLFQPNTETYWKQWRVKVEQELQRIKEGDGIEAYRVQMDRSTISDEDIYYGRAPGKVFIKPVHAIEWIPITFTVTHDSVTFQEGNTSVEE